MHSRPAELPTEATLGHRGLKVLVSGEDFDGYVVLDSVVEGRTAGGVRITDDLDLDEVEQLAAEMSLKFALFHLPRGGAKAGLRMDSGLDPKRRIRALEDFGLKLRPLIDTGLYNPGMDMNCGPDDLRAIYRGAGIELGPITDTSLFTALTVLHALESVATSLRVEGQPLRLAIEGFGSVARHLTERLDPARYRVCAISTIEGALQNSDGFELEELVAAKKRHGDSLVVELTGDSISSSAVFGADVDILLPSSRIHVITSELAHQVKARAIVPISNAPYAPGALEILALRSVQCLPGYLSNIGGVLASGLYDQGLSEVEVESLLAREYRPVVDGILRRAEHEGVLATVVAESIANGHMPERLRPSSRSIQARIFDRFLRRRMPRAWRAGQARQRFVSSARAVQAELAGSEGRKWG